MRPPGHRGTTRLASRSLVLCGVVAFSLGLAAADGYGPRAQGSEQVAPEGSGPIVRVGVAVAQTSVSVSSPAGLRFFDVLTGQPAGEIGPYATVRLAADKGALSFAGDLRSPTGVPSVEIRPAERGAPVLLNDKPYRGFAEVRVAATGVTAVNVLPLDDYLLGVVPLEIGPRKADELAAVEAQAVAARTYAVSHLGRNAAQGFDLFGTVRDQAYGGMDVELDESTRAVRNTAGVILVFDGRPIRAFYHSTCGGSTAAVEEVMDREPAPYLQSVLDRAPDGTDYCAASPRYRWSVSWTPQELDRIARNELAAHFGVPASSLGTVTGMEVLSRTESGRVKDLAFRGPGLDLVLSRLDIRRTLPSETRILYSTDFEVRQADDGLVELHGRGYGHGAGMCQWGAIGRARAGQSYEEILTTYYPGAELINAYQGVQE